MSRKKSPPPPAFDPIFHLEAGERALRAAFDQLSPLLPISSSANVEACRETFQRAFSHFFLAAEQTREPLLTSGARASFWRLHRIRQALRDPTLSTGDRLGLITHEANRVSRRGRPSKEKFILAREMQLDKGADLC